MENTGYYSSSVVHDVDSGPPFSEFSLLFSKEVAAQHWRNF